MRVAGDERLRLCVKLDSYVLAVGLRRGLEKCHPLARNGVDEGLALADHCCLLIWFVTSGRSRRHGPLTERLSGRAGGILNGLLLFVN